MVTTARRKTINDLHAMPGDGRLFELIDGEIVVAAAPGEPHLWVVKRLVALLLPLELREKLGWLYFAPSELHLPSGDVVEPDLFFVRKERASIRQGSHVAGAPDLGLEVTSPSSRHRDLVVKRSLFQAAGMQEYWIADLERRDVLPLTLHHGRYEELPREGHLVRSRILPGFVVDVEALFADLP